MGEIKVIPQYCIAHLYTVHDVRVISARTWARARTKRKEISLKLSSIAK